MNIGIQVGKEEFIKDQIESNSGNPIKCWRIIHNTTGLRKERPNVTQINLLDKNGNSFHGKEAVEYMNEYYASAGYDLLKTFTTAWSPN